MINKKVNNKALQVERKKDFSIFELTQPYPIGKPKQEAEPKKELARDNFIYNAF